MLIRAEPGYGGKYSSTGCRPLLLGSKRPISGRVASTAQQESVLLFCVTELRTWMQVGTNVSPSMS